MSASHRKSTQVHASPGQTESQVDPSSQLAATCDSVWPGLNMSRDNSVIHDENMPLFMIFSPLFSLDPLVLVDVVVSPY